jgi:hypothetical protein
MIVWREKFLATAIHFFVTMCLAACAAALIFLVWFPDPFQTMVGGTELFLLVVGCDLVLGPLISLVIYNSRKSRRKLVFDYAIVGTLQVVAMIYGVFVVASARPAYVSFSVDRLEVVTAQEFTDAELAAARNPEYATLPLTGPRLVALEVPQEEKADAIFQALKGNDIYLRPKFFVRYETQLDSIRGRARPIDVLTNRKPASKSLVEAAMRDVEIPAERVRWLPVHHNKGFWTALIDINDGKPVAYMDLDPY